MGFPQQLHAGQVLGLRSGYSGFSHPFSGQLLFRLPVPVAEFPGGAWSIDVVDGPETAAVPGIRALMTSSQYTVGARSNHVGLRLDGPVLHPEGLGEIVSHGVPVGAVEIPHSDELIILGRYRTLTAGYPIVAVATAASLSRLGQAGPGRHLRFRWVELRESLRQLQQQEEALETLEDAVHRAFSSAGLHISALTA
jgi:allophanate hydrolase subunit 2